ncbi:hypothetical protein HPB50_002205 [Hyalomma asiaticum]|uniref:Uncharacterized protein n=1 Tax=Hyalomma asiaticum TaxID=266040 RepID=A0ACB7RS69_HYAAI|nr:hypothetical protein HPB50_002205 [Hyalomma asiaticum]
MNSKTLHMALVYRAARETSKRCALAGKIKVDDIERVVHRMLRARASVAALGNLRCLPALEDIEAGLLSKDGALPPRRFSLFGR